MKKFKFKIAYKITLMFGIITINFIVFASIIYSNIRKNKNLTSYITNVSIASKNSLNELYVLVYNSRTLTRNWIYIDQKENTPDKIELQNIIKVKFPELRSKLEVLKQNWSQNDRDAYDVITVKIADTLFEREKFVMEQLNNFNAYTDPLVAFNIYPLVDETGEITILTNDILTTIKRINESLTSKEFEDIESLHQSFDRSIRLTIMIGIFILIFTIAVSIVFFRNIVYPVQYVHKELVNMGLGILSKKEMNVRNDEIGDMINALVNLTNGLLKTQTFSTEIAKGNYSAEYTPLSNQDGLGNSLIDLRNNLENAIKEAEERRRSEQIHNWITQGLATFSEILRQYNSDFDILGKTIMRNLVEYLKINQGGLFVLNEDVKTEIHLELIAVYAYNRDKMMVKKVLPGEGLVGACFAEKHTLHLTEIPNSYLTITSGLGKSNPKNILIVPLKIEEKVLGVLELASFNKFEPHEINFVEKIGESIAITIQNVRTSNETSRLLNSITQQTEAMKSQEEEMRQNMEELLATQEEAQRREEELVNALHEAQDEIRKLKS